MVNDKNNNPKYLMYASHRIIGNHIIFVVIVKHRGSRSIGLNYPDEWFPKVWQYKLHKMPSSRTDLYRHQIRQFSLFQIWLIPKYCFSYSIIQIPWIRSESNSNFIHFIFHVRFYYQLQFIESNIILLEFHYKQTRSFHF